MKLIAIMPVRNEDWVLGFSLRALLKWVDGVVVGLHNCTDHTPDIVSQVIMRESVGRVACHLFIEDSWTEMRHRQTLLESARHMGATHIVIVDADEILTANLVPGVRDAIEKLEERQTMEIPWLSVCEGWCYRTDGVWGTDLSGQWRAWVTTAFRDDPDFHWAAAGDEKYDHHHRHPMGCDGNRSVWRAVSPGNGGLLHLQFLSYRRLRAKQCLYVLNETLRWPGRMTPDELSQMYGLAVYGHNRNHPSAGAMEGVPAEWLAGYEDLIREHLHIDAEPWQETECRRLLAERGREKFSGLDLFGVV